MATQQQKVLSKNLGIKFTNEKKLKIIPIGGLNEVGINCVAIEYGKDIIVVDMGAGFPDENTTGTDLVIPDISYLRKKSRNVRGVIITHPHFDHFGAIQYLYNDIKKWKFYSSALTGTLINDGIADKQGKSNEIPINEVYSGDKIKLGVFEIEFVHVNHSVPCSNALLIKTPEGTVFHSGDYKIDLTPINEKPIDMHRLALAGHEGVKIALMESTYASSPGYSKSEGEIGGEIFNIFSKASGRIFISSFSSLVGRVQQVIDAAQKLGKKIVIDGRSMKNFTDISSDLGYLNIPEGIVVEPKFAHKLPDNALVVICTGSQGQENSAMGRISTGQHRYFKLKPGDTCVISSSPIPGNETAYTTMADNLTRKGANVITSDLLDVHTSGHCKRSEMKMLLSLLKPEILLPIHGNISYRNSQKEMAIEMGMKRKNIIILENGKISELDNDRLNISKNQIKSETVVVDGTDVSDINNIVIRERNVLGSEGFMTIILIVDMRRKRLVHNPDIISRGFVYLKDRPNLIEDTRTRVRKIFESHDISSNDWDNGLKKRIRDNISRFLYRETRKNPLIVAVVKIIR